eukprot:GFYU01004499.1.p1 GENE.GFYU01004499.1~~GFYU01004499.1.p1  ORF type:complete len:718 (+),score=151.11 GFYU01004499.1:138-2291(+)
MRTPRTQQPLSSRNLELHQAAADGVLKPLIRILSCCSDINVPNWQGFSALHLAAAHGHPDCIRALLAHNAKVDIGHKQTWSTPLHAASAVGNTECIKALVEGGASVTSLDKSGHTALHFACSGGHINAIKFLLKENIPINHVDTMGVTALHDAASHNCFDVVKILLENGADPNIGDCHQRKPLHYAAAKGYLECMDILCNQKGSKFDYRDRNLATPLHLASLSGHVEVVEGLLARGAAVNAVESNGAAAVHLASGKGHAEVVRILLDNGAKRDICTVVDGFTPLHFASSEGHTECAIVLMSHQGDEVNSGDVAVNGQRNARKTHGRPGNMMHTECDIKRSHRMVFPTSNSEAVKNNDCAGEGEFVDDCMDACSVTSNDPETESRESLEGYARPLSPSEDQAPTMASPVTSTATVTKTGHTSVIDIVDRRGWNAVHWAARGGYSNCVDAILSLTRNPEKYVCTADPQGRHPIHLATFPGQSAAVQTLINYGANVNARAQDGITAAHLAATCGSQECLQLLLSAGANGSARDRDGFTPLHFASRSGHAHCARLLLVSSCTTESRDKNEQTPVHIASANGHVEVLEILHRFECDLNVQDISGCTPLHLAVTSGHPNAVKYLLRKNSSFTIKDNSGMTPVQIGAHLSTFHSQCLTKFASVHGQESAAHVTVAGNDKSQLEQKAAAHFTYVSRHLRCLQVLFAATARSAQLVQPTSVSLYGG